MRRTSRRALALVATLAGVTHCGVVYTSSEPLWFVDCAGDDASHPTQCTCGSDLTEAPQVYFGCDSQDVGGLCCADTSQGTCSCEAVVCFGDGNQCGCSIARNTMLLSGNPMPNGCVGYRTCCMKTGSAVCACSEQDCGPGEAKVADCSSARFSCGFVQTDMNYGSDFGPEDTSACANGPVDAPVSR